MTAVVKATWDSDTFGYPVGTLTVPPHTTDLQVTEALYAAPGFRVTYVFADRPLAISGLDPVDIQETYALDIPTGLLPSANNARTFGTGITEPLRQLAYGSGLHSRFRIDPHFTAREFERLYDQWIETSVNREKADEVLVTEAKGELTGLVTLEKKDSTTLRIGLLSVHPDHRGKGIGTDLLQAAIAYAADLGFQRLKVATQSVNHAAVALYLSNGFHLQARRYTYHWWRE